MSNFFTKAAKAGAAFDDAATGQALVNFFVRGVELRRDHDRRKQYATGLTESDLKERSFRKS